MSSTKFKEIADKIRQKILAGEWKKRQKLPPDTELFKEFNANRNTVVKALQLLCDEGILLRKKGSGTFVKKNHPTSLSSKKLSIGILCKSNAYYFLETQESGIYNKIIAAIIPKLGHSIEDRKMIDLYKYNSSCLFWENDQTVSKIYLLGSLGFRPDPFPPLEAVELFQFDILILIGFIKSSWSDKLLKLNIPCILVDTSITSSSNNVDFVQLDSTLAYTKVCKSLIQKKLLPILFIGQKLFDSIPVSISMEKGNEENSDNERKEIINPESINRFNAIRACIEHESLLASSLNSVYIFDTKEDLKSIHTKIIRLAKYRRPKAIIAHHLNWASTVALELKKKDIHVHIAGSATKSYSKPNQNFIIADHKKIAEVTIALLNSRIQWPERVSICAKIDLIMSLEFK